MIRIPKKAFKFTTPNAWAGKQKLAGHPKWDVNIVMVANSEAQRYIHHSLNITQFKRDLTAALATICSQTERVMHAKLLRAFENMSKLVHSLSPIEQCAEHNRDVIIDACMDGIIRRQPSAFNHCRPNFEIATHTSMFEAQETHVHSIFSPTLQLKYNWTDLVYTDGSKQNVVDPDAQQVIGTALGAGVYVPPSASSTNDLADPNMVAQGRSIRIDPGGDGPTKTINRAELVAIYKAIDLKLGKHIATDSASSIYQVHKLIMRPRATANHKHLPLLQAIVKLIDELPEREVLTLVKVKAHLGIVGNWHADNAAGQAAQQPYTVTHTVQAYDDPPWNKIHWPHTTISAQPEQNTGSDGDAMSTALYPFASLNAPLKRHLLRKHRLGLSNKRTQYYNLLKDMVPHIPMTH